MKILITSLFFNQLASSKRFVNSLQKNTDDKLYDLAILNNGSYDGTYEYCENLKSNNIFIFHQDTNIGFSAGHNFLLEKLYERYDYIILANNDIEVQKLWLENLIKEIKEKQYDLITPINRVRNHLVIGGRFLDKNAKAEYVYYGDNNFDWLQFSCIMIKKCVFDKIGLLDIDFSPAYFEDVDFSLRAKKANFKLGVAESVIIEHYDGITSKNIDKNKILQKSKEHFVKKWKEYLEAK